MPDSTPPIPAVPADTPAPKAGPSNLRLRIIWGVIGAALLLGSVWFSPFTFGLFFAFVQAVMLWEFYRMMRAGGYAPATWWGVAASIWLFGMTAFMKLYMHADFAANSAVIPGWHTTLTPSLSWVLTPLLLLPVLLIMREMLAWPRYEKPFGNVGATLTGLAYVTLPMSLLAGISCTIPANVVTSSIDGTGGYYDYRRIFGLLFLIWASDIGAYAVGRAIGKHKLAPKISPGKTWEGWAGGFVLTLIVGWAIGYMLPDMPLTHRLVAAGVVAVFAPLGDLAESMLKRSVGVKDSGSIMPGHGGLLDRFDAFLLVLPVLALLQLLVG